MGFSAIFLLFLPFLLILLNYFVSKKFESIAFIKGYGKEIHSFAMCFWLGIVGYLYVIALPDLKHDKILNAIISSRQSESFNIENA